MRISTTKAHPKGKGRAVVRAYRLLGTGASASGDGHLPDDTDSVSISACADDGVDTSTSTRAFITFGLDDRPAALDNLICKLHDLRDHQRRLALDADPVSRAIRQDMHRAIKQHIADPMPLDMEPSPFATPIAIDTWESPPCEHTADPTIVRPRSANIVDLSDGVKFEDAQCTIEAGRAVPDGTPFCACGRRTSECDHSRAGCKS